MEDPPILEDWEEAFKLMDNLEFEEVYEEKVYDDGN